MKTSDLINAKNKYINSSNKEWQEILTLRATILHESSELGYLTKKTFDDIVEWKLGKQKNRTEKHRLNNTEDLIKVITTAVIKAKHDNLDTETKIKMNLLISIPGVGIGVASAILAFIYPKKFGVIDYLNWKEIYNNNRRIFTVNNYIKYNKKLKYIAKKLASDVEETDFIIWKYAQDKYLHI